MTSLNHRGKHSITAQVTLPPSLSLKKQISIFYNCIYKSLLCVKRVLFLRLHGRQLRQGYFCHCLNHPVSLPPLFSCCCSYLPPPAPMRTGANPSSVGPRAAVRRQTSTTHLLVTLPPAVRCETVLVAITALADVSKIGWGTMDFVSQY